MMAKDEQGSKRGAKDAWHLRTGSIVLVWLVALVGVAVAGRAIGDSYWLLIHLLALGAGSTAILIWSWYFAESVLRLPHEQGRSSQAIRLGAFNVGAVAVIVGYTFGVWPLLLAGGVLAAVAVCWHAGALFARMRGSLPSRFGPMVRYYVAAGALLPIGIGLGITMDSGSLGGDWHARLVLAHVTVNVFGWIGLTVLGTLVTLWPTILRTRIADGVEPAAHRGLVGLLAALTIAVAGAVTGSLPTAAAGLALYAIAVVVVLYPHADEVRRKHPVTFPAMSVLSGLVWLLGVLVVLVVAVASAPDWFAAEARLGSIALPLAVGFLAQVLLGALSYLIPVVTGRRPSATQAATAVLDRAGGARVAAANGGLLVASLPVPDMVRTLCGAVAVAALATFLPLAVGAVVAARRAAEQPIQRGVRKARAPEVPVGRRIGRAAPGLAAVVLAAAVGVAVNPAALHIDTGTGANAGVNTGTATQASATDAPVTTVSVRIDGLRFAPDAVTVPNGHRLVIVLHNTGDQRHDLVLANGARTPRISPGQSARLDAGVVTHDVAGWCSVAGHRMLGMVFAVHVSDAQAGSLTGGTAPTATGDAHPDLSAPMPPGFTARDPALPPPGPGTVHRYTFDVRDVRAQVAPGVTQTRWTYNGTAPGPTLHGRVGDTFVVTLRNDGHTGHSIDFHAGSLAPDGPMRTIQPGGSLVYRFTATRSGIWLYHCATDPMSLHMANGMFGAVVIDPPNLPPVAREYVLVQSELYLGPQGATADEHKLATGQPDLVVFNGVANQYDHAPLPAKVGERVRIWVLDAGPNRSTSFHIVGGQFDTVWKEGAYLLRPGNASDGGSQALDLSPAQGGFVELTFPQAGTYPFLSHIMIDAERGAHGTFRVTG